MVSICPMTQLLGEEPVEAVASPGRAAVYTGEISCRLVSE